MTKIRAQRYPNVVGRMFLVKTPTSSVSKCKSTSCPEFGKSAANERCSKEVSRIWQSSGQNVKKLGPNVRPELSLFKALKSGEINTFWHLKMVKTSSKNRGLLQVESPTSSLQNLRPPDASNSSFEDVQNSKMFCSLFVISHKKKCSSSPCRFLRCPKVLPPQMSLVHGIRSHTLYLPVKQGSDRIRSVGKIDDKDVPFESTSPRNDVVMPTQKIFEI